MGTCSIRVQQWQHLAGALRCISTHGNLSVGGKNIILHPRMQKSMILIDNRGGDSIEFVFRLFDFLALMLLDLTIFRLGKKQKKFINIF